jgi:hypothetical protein
MSARKGPSKVDPKKRAQLDALHFLVGEAEAYQGRRSGADYDEALAMVHAARDVLTKLIVEHAGDEAYIQSMREFVGRKS